MKFARIEGNSVAEILRTESIENKFHPSIKWVDITSNANVEVGDVFDGVNFSKPVSTIDVKSEIVRNTQARLDAWAATRAYDGILSACTYATSSVPRFQREGQDAVNARDATWAALYTIMGKVQAGELPMPSGFADIEPLLPVLEWTP